MVRRARGVLVWVMGNRSKVVGARTVSATAPRVIGAITYPAHPPGIIGPMDVEFDDDKRRVDVEAIHAFLSTQAYWALGRPLKTQQRLVDEASRVVGAYRGQRQIGFCRAVTDGVSFAYLADVYLLPEYRGHGRGERLLQHMIDGGPHKHCRWLLHTGDMHPLYRKLGFTEPSERVMERRPDA
jgi:GNAT superfamily N-acetyltransferase